MQNPGNYPAITPGTSTKIPAVPPALKQHQRCNHFHVQFPALEFESASLNLDRIPLEAFPAYYSSATRSQPAARILCRTFQKSRVFHANYMWWQMRCQYVFLSSFRDDWKRSKPCRVILPIGSTYMCNRQLIFLKVSIIIMETNKVLEVR